MSQVTTEKVTSLAAGDLDDLCKATEDAIRDGIGFGWMTPPTRDVLESYWKGALLVPRRSVFLGRLDGAVAGSVQLLRPSKSKETSAFSCDIEAHFVAPWARGHGIAKALLEAAEREAAHEGFSVLRLSVRESQHQAMRLYRESGYIEWGKLPYHEFINSNMISGYFFYKRLNPISDLI
jgi:ribosomal protein S18 acetylase RimI-like enzyme